MCPEVMSPGVMSLTQAVSWTDVDLKDGHAAARDLPGTALDGHLVNNAT